MHARSLWIRSADGIRLNVRHWGLGTTKLLLVHGLGDGGFVWHPLVRLLCPSMAVLAPDLRGHGDSDWDPCSHYSIESYCADVKLVIQSLGLRDVTVVGHSLGGAIAATVVTALGECARALVLIESVPVMRSQGLQQWLGEFRLQRTTYDSVAEYTQVLQARLPLASAATLDEYAGHALRLDGGRFALKSDSAVAAAGVLSSPPSEWAALAEANLPVLIIRGALSAMVTQADTALLASRLSRARTVCLPTAGHATVLEDPCGVAAALEDFVAAGTAVVPD